ncbi:dehydratase [Paraburkholderia sp. Ac-20336]|uniref:MaoC family dehydratase n=1 Tax=Burkholderiaceae TaxID=119060 RepID=UPI00141D8CBE|nr:MULTISPECIES: MaoC/PaaZ C-terminal domain-containing protein [Burkholderiaceae]MBN3803494.1 dehydratase [Paraburkholderia sp. Ac-20336]MBN3849146.1 dehydratase [Paraburkholderia sp. Ac-20342]NIF55842.1 dehydratase [Burkholderia sp. Ax-1724]NIF79470.1 dehydratase [Paraburkholderia sp. Cy-641]
MSDFYLKPGDTVSLEQHVSAEAIRAFADVSGDHSPNHVDEQAMAASAYGRVIAHGALMVAYMSACSTAIVERVQGVRERETPVSLGYDRVRFLKPVFAGDTLRLDYTIRDVDPERRRTVAEIRIVNQEGELVSVAEHILKWVVTP